VTPDLARAERAQAVRAAARSWQRAGAVDETVVAAVDARCPDDRVRVGPVFRALLFLFTLIAVGGFYGFVSLFANFHDGDGWAALAVLGGLAMVVATEVQIGTLRRRQGGTEAATSFLAIDSLLGAAAWWLFAPSFFDEWTTMALICLTAAGLLAAAAWRWGYPLYAGVATAALLAALTPLPGARLLWIVLPLAAAPVLLRFSRSPRLPPSHRASLTAVAFVALAGLYAAVHLGSWDAQLIEVPAGRSSVADSDLLWWCSVAATALVPAVLLAVGLRRRRYPLLLLATVTAAISLVTLRYYVHLAPLWVILVASGATLAAAVLALRKYLDSGADGERHGFTTSPLFADLARQRVLEAGVAVLAFSPEARTLPEAPKYEGGGGEFGGGGASGSF
jgi:uncharacterized membrane protein YgcG